MAAVRVQPWQMVSRPARGRAASCFAFVATLVCAASAALAGVACGEPPARTTPGPEWAAATAAKMDSLAARLVALVNARRASLKRPPLSVDPRIGRVAREYASAMAASGRFSHRSQGQAAGDRLRAASIVDWDVVAENLALSSTVRPPPSGRAREASLCHDVDSLAADIESGWYESPAHRRNMTLPELTNVGTGAAYDTKTDTVYVVQVYVRKLSKAP
jgi:uncharacterized protein YkwD